MREYWIVDAFAAEAFSGNPAAVVPVEDGLDDRWAQDVAAEFNLSETAFPRPVGEGEWELRWFTPTTEVDLCGHATLATAHVLGLQGHAGPMRFQTRSGPLVVEREGEHLWMDFPAAEPQPAEVPAGLAEALGTEPRGAWSGSTGDLLVELDDASAVLGLAPDLAALARIPARGIIATAAARGSHDFVSRFFAPAVGVAEDPVTGSTHTMLAPFWSARTGKDELVAFQASRRGGELRLRMRPGGRVLIGGSTVTVMTGTLHA
ncbi:PhzF family phenazine biosynthesis protein [Lolliginicoccus suaedae]|uniref:PhzF family phenazine biosynthesis protein n=1 Tax=Lolliginicoccus suaedae TaxID=2605429 RepID=UPI0011EDA844|nr:PhzF family phenazine biosynthesis protein [Lolliginicoccus suaedae]